MSTQMRVGEPVVVKGVEDSALKGLLCVVASQRTQAENERLQTENKHQAVLIRTQRDKILSQTTTIEKMNTTIQQQKETIAGLRKEVQKNEQVCMYELLSLSVVITEPLFLSLCS